MLQRFFEAALQHTLFALPVNAGPGRILAVVARLLKGPVDAADFKTYYFSRQELPPRRVTPSRRMINQTISLPPVASLSSCRAFIFLPTIFL